MNGYSFPGARIARLQTRAREEGLALRVSIHGRADGEPRSGLVIPGEELLIDTAVLLWDLAGDYPSVEIWFESLSEVPCPQR